MSVIARRFASIPERTAMATWKAISALLASDSTSDPARELASVAGIASSLITREAMTAPLVVYGSGPRVRIYCLYNEDAIEGDDGNEAPLSFDATAGDWKISLPCPADDLQWAQNSLKAKSTRISARDMTAPVEDEDDTGEPPAYGTSVDLEAFFKS
jgi:hypothetical protein